METIYNADWLRAQNIRLSLDAKIVADIAALQTFSLDILHRSNTI
jgi:hypothetical protein